MKTYNYCVMEKLESISRLRQLLFLDNDLIELMQHKGLTYVLTKLKERFCNIDEFDEEIINKEVEVRFSSINHLVDKDGKFKSGWKDLLMRRIYWKLFEEVMDSEEKKYARRAGLGTCISDYDVSQRIRINEISELLENKILSNELKNQEQASQFVDFLIYEKFNC